MAAARTPNRGPAPTPEQLDARLSQEGLSRPRWWSNAPGDTYGWHDHPYHKVLFCSQGSIVFHTRQGDVELHPGDRLDIEPGTEHAATVGPEGVACVEAPKSR
ncbi:MAG TPA: cupin domain-containing protein [Actinomycetota bacterium]|nr:cupin domain-containing protein [Actinomycetota bacterium]